MSLTPSLLAAIILLFVVVFLLGFRLTRAGKPYSSLILTIHKLAALAALVMLAQVVIRQARASGLEMAVWLVSAAGGVFFVVAILSGGLLSTDKTLPPVVKVLHRASSFLAALAAALTLILLR